MKKSLFLPFISFGLSFSGLNFNALSAEENDKSANEILKNSQQVSSASSVSKTSGINTSSTDDNNNSANGILKSQQQLSSTSFVPKTSGIKFQIGVAGTYVASDDYTKGSEGFGARAFFGFKKTYNYSKNFKFFVAPELVYDYNKSYVTTKQFMLEGTGPNGDRSEDIEKKRAEVDELQSQATQLHEEINKIIPTIHYNNLLKDFNGTTDGVSFNQFGKFIDTRDARLIPLRMKSLSDFILDNSNKYSLTYDLNSLSGLKENVHDALDSRKNFLNNNNNVFSTTNENALENISKKIQQVGRDGSVDLTKPNELADFLGDTEYINLLKDGERITEEELNFLREVDQKNEEVRVALSDFINLVKEPLDEIERIMKEEMDKIKTTKGDLLEEIYINIVDKAIKDGTYTTYYDAKVYSSILHMFSYATKFGFTVWRFSPYIKASLGAMLTNNVVSADVSVVYNTYPLKHISQTSSAKKLSFMYGVGIGCAFRITDNLDVFIEGDYKHSSYAVKVAFEIPGGKVPVKVEQKIDLLSLSLGIVLSF